MDDDIEYVLRRYRTWAVVGCSPQPWRDSHRIAAMLKARGYRVIPVNPEAGGELLGEHCYDALPADQGIEVVDLFRRSSAVGVHVDGMQTPSRPFGTQSCLAYMPFLTFSPLTPPLAFAHSIASFM